MYSTFRIKPYLVQIHENVVLILFKPSDVFAKHCHMYSSTVIWEKPLPIQVTKISTTPFVNDKHTMHLHLKKSFFLISLQPFQTL